MSMDASGTFGGTLTYSKWKGKNYVRQHVIPSNPRSVGQQTARGALGAAGKINNRIDMGSALQVALNAAAPSGQSGVSFFAGRQAKSMATSKTDYATAGNSTVKGYFDAAAADIGLTTLTIAGDTPLTVAPGLQLWNAYSAAHLIDNTIATTLATAATEGSIATFVDAFMA